MGTNFYWHMPQGLSIALPTGEEVGLERDSMDPRFHIGKRSAAGRYCWDCDETLVIGGKEMVHHGSGQHERCPCCGQEPEEQGYNSAMVELGFSKPASERPRGVQTASSFSWAQNPEQVGTICRQRASDPLVEDEYGRVLTGQEFLDMLACNCPIQFTDSIGEWFS